MGDVLLTVAICITQFLLGYMGVHVSLKPPLPKHHKHWIVAFILIGATGIFLTAWLAKRVGDAQMQANIEIHQAQQAATNANIAATKANIAATAAQNETKAAREDASRANTNLQKLINQKSQETNKNILAWRSDTESAVGRILQPPRTLGDKRTDLIRELKKSGPHEIAITACRGNKECLDYSNEIESAFKEAGWTIVPSRLGFLVKDAVGVYMIVKSMTGNLRPDQLAVAMAFNSIGRQLIGQEKNNVTDDGPVELYVGLQ